MAQYHCDERIFELVGRLRRVGLNSKDQLTSRRTPRGVHSALRLDGIAQLWVNIVDVLRAGKSIAPTKRKRTERVQLMVSADELSAFNEFRFHARMPNVAAAVRELIKRGMGSVKKDRSPKSM